ncbi:hypothetical protein HQ533_03225 [Candidatus Woesearchaeota archaeon]|nr:hypothetical protein [Candidatus Woesearchaeota archaeon]
MIKCVVCKSSKVDVEGDENICRECGLIWTDKLYAENKNYKYTGPPIMLLAGDGTCPKCKKKGLHHGSDGTYKLLGCIKCGYEKKELENVLEWRFNLNEASVQLKRAAACVTLPDEDEAKAHKILADFKKEKYGLVDIFKAMVIAVGDIETVDTKSLRSAIPYTDKELDDIFEEIRKDKGPRRTMACRGHRDSKVVINKDGTASVTRDWDKILERSKKRYEERKKKK